MSLQTEYDFSLPRGYLDRNGQLHRQGRMRLATARDEIRAAQDPRVENSPAYLPVLLISQVITSLGGLPSVSPQVVEGMFAADLAYLEDLYLRINSHQPVLVGAACPHCGSQFQLQVAPLE
jgi:hypothetical protein